jgi:hypothetical protein
VKLFWRIAYVIARNDQKWFIENRWFVGGGLGLVQFSACPNPVGYIAIVVALNTAMRHSEIPGLHWRQIDLDERTLTVGQSKAAAGTRRLIPLNMAAFAALAKWAGWSFSGAAPEHYVFPWCEHGQIDPAWPTKGWRTAWRHALKLSGVKCRFHDRRVTAITELAEGQASDKPSCRSPGTSHDSRIRTDAKRAALERLVQPVLQHAVHENANQLRAGESEATASLIEEFCRGRERVVFFCAAANDWFSVCPKVGRACPETVVSEEPFNFFAGKFEKF